MCGSSALDKVQKAVLQCLPRQGKDTTINEVVAELTQLSDSRLLTFCGTGEKAVVSSVKAWCVSMQQGTCPKYPSGNPTQFVTSVKAALARLCKVDKATNEGSATKLVGRGAAEHMFALVEAKGKERDLKVTCADLAPLNSFAWLLSAEQNKAVEAWGKRVLGAQDEATGASSSSAAPAPKAAPKKGAKARVQSLVKGMLKSA